MSSNSAWTDPERVSGLCAAWRTSDAWTALPGAGGLSPSTKAYLARFKLAEIAELLGWSAAKVERIIDRYVNKNALLRDKIRRLDEARENARGTNPAKPAAKSGA